MELIETLIIIVIACLIGIGNEKTKPKEYYYENRIVTVYKKYQCPTYCEVDHPHFAHLDTYNCGNKEYCWHYMYIKPPKDAPYKKIKRK